jgi:hypothetical protein
MQCTRSVAVLALVAVGCGFKQSNAIDLAQVEGSPVRLANVRMAESLFASLGGGSASFSSSDKANAIGIAYDVHVTAEAKPYSGVSARLACRVGDRTVVGRFGTDASNRLASAEIGTTFEERDTFPPTPFAAEIPKVCETTLYYTVAPPLAAVPEPGDAIEPSTHERLALGTVCFADDELTEGPCSADVLPRVPADAPLAVSQVVGHIGSVSGGGYGVQVSVLVTAGDDVPERFVIGADAQCKVGEELRDASLQLIMVNSHLRPGESFWQLGATSSQRALDAEPKWCTVEIAMAKDGEKQPLSQHCIRGTDVSNGACA